MAFPTIMICNECKGGFPYDKAAPQSGLCPKCEYDALLAKQGLPIKTKKLCSTCHLKTNDYGYGDGLCSSCRQEKKYAPKMFLPPKKDEPKMKNGEIRKLPKENSPLWTEQWAVQGTPAKPYVVSKKIISGENRSIWSCSCPNWTQHVPRTECKHILSVIVKEKFTVPAGPASMDKETAKEFATFQKARARKAANVKEDWGISEGRKFR